MNYWLMKSEPGEFSIVDLEQRASQTEPWDGVRNYQARNIMRDEMKVGDKALFYHSNCEEPGIVGIVQVVRQGYPDYTAFDPDNKHCDPKSSPAQPRWFMVDVRFVKKLARIITLKELREHQQLTELPLVRRGNRLSVMPISEDQWNFILSLE
ncbi:MAG: EVE domain-containing protein [Pseudomonadota bacterium]